MTKEELTRIAPDYTNEKFYSIYVDGQKVYEVRSSYLTDELLQIMKKHFPGRFAYVLADNYIKERNWATIAGRLYRVGKTHNNGDRCFIQVTSSKTSEEKHRERVEETKKILQENAIPIYKGVCTVTFVEEC